MIMDTLFWSMDIIYSYFLIDKILYSSPDFPSGKDITHPKRPPIQEAPTGQKCYRYAVIPEMSTKIQFLFRISRTTNKEPVSRRSALKRRESPIASTQTVAEAPALVCPVKQRDEGGRLSV